MGGLHNACDHQIRATRPSNTAAAEIGGRFMTWAVAGIGRSNGSLRRQSIRAARRQIAGEKSAARPPCSFRMASRRSATASFQALFRDAPRPEPTAPAPARMTSSGFRRVRRAKRPSRRGGGGLDKPGLSGLGVVDRDLTHGRCRHGQMSLVRSAGPCSGAREPGVGAVARPRSISTPSRSLARNSDW